MKKNLVVILLILLTLPSRAQEDEDIVHLDCKQHPLADSIIKCCDSLYYKTSSIELLSFGGLLKLRKDTLPDGLILPGSSSIIITKDTIIRDEIKESKIINKEKILFDIFYDYAVSTDRIEECFCSRFTNAIIFYDKLNKRIGYLILDFGYHQYFVDGEVKIKIKCLDQYLAIEKYFNEQGITTDFK